MHGGFASFGKVLDLPFIARQSARDPIAVRALLNLPGDTPLVLLSFGGYGLTHIDLQSVAALQGYTVIVTGDVTANRRAEAARQTAGTRSAADDPGQRSNLVSLDETALFSAGVRYEDLVAAVDVVTTKPGYGIISECIANDTALVYTSRGHFVEYDVLVREMPRWLRTAFISNDDLLAGRWQPVLDHVLAASAPPERTVVDGASRAAEIVLASL